MELSVRDWMIIVGLLLVVVVLVDGFRRVRNERRGGIRMSLNKQFVNASGEDDDVMSPELPSGGARVVDRDTGESSDLKLDQPVPMLMDPISAAAEEEDLDRLAEAEEGMSSQPELEESAEPELQEEAVSDTIELESEDVNPEDQEVIVVNVAAKDGAFKGSDLLHILLACDCRFGEMNIFHRHEDSSGRGKVQFSIVNSVEPGVFNLDDIDNFETPGVCFFVSVPGPKDPVHAFDCMVETAQCLVKNLNGELLDESRSVMTAQTIEHCRQRIRDVVRKQLTQPA